MKKLIIAAFAAVLSIAAFSQSSNVKFAYVDSEYILSNIPEYKQALDEVDALAVKWQKEIEASFQEIDALYKKFQNDAPLLSEEMSKKRQNEIINKEKDAKELQKKRFGVDGDLFQKRQEVLKPIQDKVFTAIEKRATDKGYTFVFDRSDNAQILFADSRVDISNDILGDLGIKVNTKPANSIVPQLGSKK
ncbi:MAG: OmpH family outer membrane protein [Bacteroidales bacterium]|jgi:outer membrane protein|nr:OmpH family outer membrane protein [Bacteroidales bacterium]